MKKFYSFILLLLLTVNIISCGYQLRGTDEIKFKSISIAGGSASFTKILNKKFKQAGVKIESENAEKNLEIITDTYSKQILSLSSDGKVKEYKMKYKVSFRFKLKGGEWSAPINIETNRDYTYDDKNIIAKTEEELRIIKGMQEQIIRSMTMQISLSN